MNGQSGRIGLTVIAAAALALAVFPVQARDRTLEFRVLLDENEIGRHTYQILPSDNGYEVRSEASFDVRFLFITAYRYRHSNTEVWLNDCLSGINSRTSANGKETFLTGTADPKGFTLNTSGGTQTVEGCVSTFAYWDRSFMERGRLLNPQTGDIIEVDVESLEEQQLDIGGRRVTAQRYRLTAEKIRLDLWYGPNDQWLALESPAKGGRTLRYERI